MATITTTIPKTTQAISTTTTQTEYIFDKSQSDITFVNSGNYKMTVVVKSDIPYEIELRPGQVRSINNQRIFSFKVVSDGNSTLNISCSPWEYEDDNSKDLREDVEVNTGQVIYEVALAEAANGITVTVDKNGNALNLKRAEINILVPAGCSATTGSSASVCCRLNDIATGYVDPAASSDSLEYFRLGLVRNVWGSVSSIVEVLAGTGFVHRSLYAYSDGTNRTSAGYSNGKPTGVAAINKIYIYLGSSYTFPAGTIFEIRGSRV